MKWHPGDTPWWQYLAEDGRYTVAKAVCPERTTYRAWYVPSTRSAEVPLCAHTEDLNVARKAAEAHYAAMQRKAA